MEKYLGKEVCLSNQALYEKFGRYLRWNIIDKTEENGTEYYDIYESFGNILGMDGETCIVEEVGHYYVLLLNENGEVTTHIKLTTDEFVCGCIIYDNIE